MPLRLSCAAVLAALAMPLPSQAQPAAVCASPEVLDMVAQILAKSGSTARIQAGPVGQSPTAQPGTVACAVRLLDWYYDTVRFGPAPQPWTRTYSFTVRRGRNGLFVEPVSGG